MEISTAFQRKNLSRLLLTLVVACLISSCSVQRDAALQQTEDDPSTPFAAIEVSLSKALNGIRTTVLAIIDLGRAVTATVADLFDMGSEVAGEIDEVQLKVQEGVQTIQRGVEAVRSVQSFLQSLRANEGGTSSQDVGRKSDPSK